MAERFAGAGSMDKVRPVVVGPGSAAAAGALQARWKTPFPVLADPTGEALDALGLTRTWGLIRKSGTLAIDRQGVLCFAHRGAQPGDALRLREALEAVGPADSSR